MPSPSSPLPAYDNVETHSPRQRSGPGWYDSSWDLICGLDIAEVPDLDTWIGAYLSVSPAGAPA